MDRVGHPLRPRGWHHAFRRAHKQFVVQHVAQARERVADGGLGQSQTLSGPRQVLLLHDRVEDNQEI